MECKSIYSLPTTETIPRSSVKSTNLTCSACYKEYFLSAQIDFDSLEVPFKVAKVDGLKQ